jgi:hypothetical protein
VIYTAIAHLRTRAQKSERSGVSEKCDWHLPLDAIAMSATFVRAAAIKLKRF